MTSTKTILLAAAVVLTLGSTAQAFTGDSQDEPFSIQGRPQVFAYSVPRLDLGSEAYLSTRGQGAGEQGLTRNQVTREGVAAYQRGFDTGSEAYPTVP